MNDGSVAHADDEADLVEGEAEETEIEEDPKIMEGPTDAASAGGFGEGGETEAEEIDEENEDAG